MHFISTAKSKDIHDVKLFTFHDIVSPGGGEQFACFAMNEKALKLDLGCTISFKTDLNLHGCSSYYVTDRISQKSSGHKQPIVMFNPSSICSNYDPGK